MCKWRVVDGYTHCSTLTSGDSIPLDLKPFKFALLVARHVYLHSVIPNTQYQVCCSVRQFCENVFRKQKCIICTTYMYNNMQILYVNKLFNDTCHITSWSLCEAHASTPPVWLTLMYWSYTCIASLSSGGLTSYISLFVLHFLGL